jgi:uncharacterized protein YifN (PemK superfamily)
MSDAGEGGDEAARKARLHWPNDEEIEADGWVRISRRARRIDSSPRARQYFWVDFPHDAFAPEFVGEHPGVVLRSGKITHGTCIIVPVTSKPQIEERYVHKLSVNPNPKGQRDGVEAYAVCDHLYTVNICRLRPILSLRGHPIYPRVAEEDFTRIGELVRMALFPAQPGQKPSEPPVPAVAAGEAGPGVNPVSGRKILKLRGFGGASDENH